MPTKAASYATAPRMRSTSAASAVSASGSAGISCALIEIRLQDQLRGNLVAMRSSCPAAALAIQLALCDFGRPAFVDLGNRQSKAIGECARKTPGLCRHRVGRAVGVRRQPDDQRLRLPLLDEGG